VDLYSDHIIFFDPRYTQFPREPKNWRSSTRYCHYYCRYCVYCL